MTFKKYSALLVLILLIIAGCNPNNTKQPDAGVYKVVKIRDGDTLGLLTGDNQQVTVRLAEIDCPEKSQAFGQAAKKFTSDLCFGKEVKLIGNEHDRYGRTVAQVVLIDGTNINYALVKNGYELTIEDINKAGGVDVGGRVVVRMNKTVGPVIEVDRRDRNGAIGIDHVIAPHREFRQLGQQRLLAPFGRDERVRGACAARVPHGLFVYK